MSHSFNGDDVANTSCNPRLTEVATPRLSRRDLLKAAGVAGVLSILPLGGCASMPRGRAVMGFKGIDVSDADTVRVPDGYTATTFYSWGDPIGHSDGSPAFKMNGSNTAAEQALQAGMHHDGMHYFPLPYGSQSSTRGLLAVNHAYTDEGLLHTDGFAAWNADKVQKAQNAHGVSVVEVALENGRWNIVRPSRKAEATAGTSSTSASTPASIRTNRIAMAGWSSSIPTIPEPSRSSAPPSDASAMKAP